MTNDGKEKRRSKRRKGTKKTSGGRRGATDGAGEQESSAAESNRKIKSEVKGQRRGGGEGGRNSRRPLQVELSGEDRIHGRTKSAPKSGIRNKTRYGGAEAHVRDAAGSLDQWKETQRKLHNLHSEDDPDDAGGEENATAPPSKTTPNWKPSSKGSQPPVSSALRNYLAGQGAPLANYRKNASGGSSTVSSAMYSGLMTEDRIWLAEAGAAPPANQSTLGTIEDEKPESDAAVPTQEAFPPSDSSALRNYLAGQGAPLANYRKNASGGSSVSSAMYSGLMTEDRIWLAEAGAPPLANEITLGTIEDEKPESEEAVPTQEAAPRRRMVRRSSSHNDIESMMAKAESKTPAEVDNNPDISTRSEPPLDPPRRDQFPRRTSDDWNHLISLKVKARELKQLGLSAEKVKAKELVHLGTAETCADVTAGTNSAPKTAPKVFGDEEEKAESKHRQKKKLMLLLMALVLLLVFILSIVFGLRGDSSSNNAATVDSVGGATGKGNADGSSKPMAPAFQPTFPASSPVGGDLSFEGMEAAAINKPAGPTSPLEDLEPSKAPVVVYKETVHIVQMLMKNVDDQFSLSTPYVNSILRHITSFVNTHLEQPYELRSVELQEGVRDLIAPQSNIRRRRRLQTFTIPLRITIFGPGGLHMTSILELFLDTTDIRNYLKTLNVYAFREVTVSFQSDFLDEQDNGTFSPVDSMPVALTPSVVPPTEPLPSPSSEKPIPIPTNRPTSKPSYKTFPTCPQDLIYCDNGASVFRNPLNDCQFFPCPGNSKPVVDTSASTSEPSRPIAGSPLAPTDPPVTTRPTPSPTLSPSVKITSKAPVSEVPTEVPTLKPTSTTSVVCTSLGNGQCDAPLTIGSKCFSSDTQSDDNYGHAVALTTRSNGQVLAVVGSR